MKKLLFLIPLILFSCSKDSIDSTENQDPIIGIWKPIANIDKFEDEPELVEDFSYCKQQSRINFKANGEIAATSKGLNDEGECTDYEPITGSWEKLTGNTYKIISIEKEDGEEKIMTETLEFIFSDDQMRNLFYEDEESGEYDYDLYLRVE